MVAVARAGPLRCCRRFAGCDPRPEGTWCAPCRWYLRFPSASFRGRKTRNRPSSCRDERPVLPRYHPFSTAKSVPSHSPADGLPAPTMSRLLATDRCRPDNAGALRRSLLVSVLCLPPQRLRCCAVNASPRFQRLLSPPLRLTDTFCPGLAGPFTFATVPARTNRRVSGSDRESYFSRSQPVDIRLAGSLGTSNHRGQAPCLRVVPLEPGVNLRWWPVVAITRLRTEPRQYRWQAPIPTRARAARTRWITRCRRDSSTESCRLCSGLIRRSQRDRMQGMQREGLCQRARS